MTNEDSADSRLAGHIYIVTNSWADDAEVAAEKIAGRLYGRGSDGTFQVFKPRPERLGGGIVPFGDHLRVAC